jgi:hypothetical protein
VVKHRKIWRPVAQVPQRKTPTTTVGAIHSIHFEFNAEQMRRSKIRRPKTLPAEPVATSKL